MVSSKVVGLFFVEEKHDLNLNCYLLRLYIEILRDRSFKKIDRRFTDFLLEYLKYCLIPLRVYNLINQVWLLCITVARVPPANMRHII